MFEQSWVLQVAFLVLCLCIFNASSTENDTDIINANSASSITINIPNPAATVASIQCNSSESHAQSSGGHEEELRESFHIFEFLFEHVKPMYMVTCWLLAACVLKILFHMAPWLSNHVPESAVLITLGVLLGGILRLTGVGSEHYKLDAYTFFYFMLPPIVFDSGFHMPNRAFFGNIGTILLFAVVGTCFNAMAVGLTLYGVCYAASFNLPILTCLLYGSLISAVDPVGVLSVFEEVHVNEMLYIIVFGESLLNDAVTVVLYNVFNAFIEINSHHIIDTRDIVLGVVSLFVVGIGGVVIGVFFGLVTAFVTRFTDHVRVIEPVFIFIFGYLSYLTADMVRMSGILAAVFCGITMRRYVNTNVNRKSQITINYSVKMIAVVSETVVFMFIGMTSVLDLVDFNIAFFFTSLAACALYRPIGVVMGSWIINHFRTIKLTWLDQFIMSYGGLRGPIAYALCALINKELIPEKDILLSACMGVIFFTAFIQGGTIRFLVEGLNVKRANKSRPTMNQRIHERLLDHAMAGIEDISGLRGSQYMRVMWESFDNRFLKPLLLKEVPQTKEHGIIKTFSKLNVQDAIRSARERGSASNVLDQSRRPSVPNLARRGITHESVAEALNLVFQRGLASDVLPESGIAPSDTAVDLQMLEAPVRKKDMDDAKIRHILDDAMYKPRDEGKSRAIISRHTIVDRDPDFINNNPRARWQMRELMSTISPSTQQQQQQGPRYRRNTDIGYNRTRNRDLLTVPQVTFQRTVPSRSREDQTVPSTHIQISETDDDGLQMSTPSHQKIDEETEQSDDDGLTMSESFPRQPTAAESQLPWHTSTDEPALARRVASNEPRFMLGEEDSNSSQSSPEEYELQAPTISPGSSQQPHSIDTPVSSRTGEVHKLNMVPESSDAEDVEEV